MYLVFSFADNLQTKVVWKEVSKLCNNLYETVDVNILIYYPRMVFILLF